MKFIHGYDERYLPGLMKRGFWNRHSGLKVVQHFATPEDEKFNVIGAKGAKLHRLVKEASCPFYIDRFQGGTFYSKYDFSKSLLQEYLDLLGEWFIGLQMHEWGGSINGDWSRIRGQLAGVPRPWTESQIHDAVKQISSCKWCIHLSGGSALEYSRRRYSETWREYLDEMRDLFRLRQKEVGGLLLPCDSYAMATPMECGLGARAIMPEVGAQIPLTRLQVALARGMATALRRPWGVYYEPWGGNPFSAPHFFEQPLNEWRLDNSIFPYDFTKNGPNGGSSRSLQRRIFHHAWMAGANFISEEWGVSNTFHDWRDYPLTPYGEVKKDFIDFAYTRPAPEPFVPFAIVLPKELEVIDLHQIASPDGDTYIGRELDSADKPLFSHIRDALRLVFAANGKAYGNESHVLTNNNFCDCFDLIHENVGESALSKYSCLIDASPASSFACSATGKKLRTLKSAELGLLERELERVMALEAPCQVSGGIHWMLARQEGKWLLAMFNNNGVDRGAAHGDGFMPEAAITASIRFKNEPKDLNTVKSWPEGGESLKRHIDGGYLCAVHPGGLHIVEFRS